MNNDYMREKAITDNEELIDTLQNEILVLEQEEETLKKYDKKDVYIPGDFIVSLIFTPIFTFGFLGIAAGLSRTTIVAMLLANKNILIGALSFFSCMISIGVLLSKSEYKKFNAGKKQLKNIQKDLNYARNQLDFANERKIYLETIKSKESTIEELRRKKINKLEALKKNLNDYYNFEFTTNNSRNNINNNMKDVCITLKRKK